MHPLHRNRRILYSTSALIGLLIATPAFAAFDPSAGADTAQPAQYLPDTSALYEEGKPRPLYAPNAVPAPAVTASGYISPLQPIQMPRPLYPARVQTTPIIVATPVVETPAAVAPVSIVAPAPVIAAMPAIEPAPEAAIQVSQPTVIAPAPVIIATPDAPATTTTEAVVEVPNLPAVDPAVAAKAQAMLNAEASQPAPPSTATPIVIGEVPTTSDGFVAPAPLLAAETPAAPVVVTAPVVVPATADAVAQAPAPVVVAPPAPPTPVAVIAAEPAAPASTLSEQTRQILSEIPSRLDTAAAQPTTSTKLDRVSPQIQNVLGNDAKEDAYESVGLSIKVRRPGMDTNYELNNAYTALMGGDTERAIEIYKNILGNEPTNEDALFGLAATYHRLGQTDKARPFYGMLLKQNPNHREGLNNFLVLVSDESPADALPELERLELRNPDFSPIPAQIAIVYDKMGYPDKAEDAMLRAIDLAPDNLTYKYNLAIMLDQHERYADATAMYRMLIQASLRGEHVPASVESMQKRLNYLTTAMTENKAGS